MFCDCALPSGSNGMLYSSTLLFLLVSLVCYVLRFLLFLLVSLVGYVLRLCSSFWYQWYAIFFDFALSPGVIGMLCSAILLFLLGPLVGYVLRFCSSSWYHWQVVFCDSVLLAVIGRLCYAILLLLLVSLVGYVLRIYSFILNLLVGYGL